MLRIISALVFLFFSLPGALVAQTIKYVVHGKVSNCSFPAKAYLYYTSKGVIKIDSANINGGRFTLHGVSTHSTNRDYLVVSKSGNRMASTDVVMTRFYTDAPVISMMVDDSLGQVTATGGSLNRDDNKFKAALASVEAKFTAVNKAFASLTDEQKNSKSVRESFEQKIEALQHEKVPVYRRFIKFNPNSVVSLRALMEMGGNDPDVAEVEPPFNSLSARVRSTTMGKEYAATIAKIKKTVIGTTAPDFTLHDTSGKPVSLHDFKGKYILLDFWASWCPPCRAESPYITEAFKAYEQNNFTVLGISLDNPDKKNEWLAAIHEDNLTWTQVASLTMWENAAAKQYSVTSIPKNFLIDPNGKIIAKNLRGTALGEKLKEIFGH